MSGKGSLMIIPKHKYIDADKLFDFSEKGVGAQSIYDDLQRLKITNIIDEYYMMTLAEYLESDYYNKRANYKAYIEGGMNARILMNLRKSALIHVEGSVLFPDFYIDHCKCETVQDIRNLRIKYLKFLNEDYMDLDWQVYTLIRMCWGATPDDTTLELEAGYVDGDWRLQMNPEDYKRERLKQFIRPSHWEKYFT